MENIETANINEKLTETIKTIYLRNIFSVKIGKLRE